MSDEESVENPLLAPCKCTGSVKMIHLVCLKTWIGRKDIIRVTTHSQVTTYSWKAFHCELCKARYEETIFNPLKKGQVLYLFEIEKPIDTDYMIFESYLLDKNQASLDQKSLHVVHFGKPDMKNQITIGRGHDSDIRVNDISVSRCHSFVKYCSKSG